MLKIVNETRRAAGWAALQEARDMSDSYNNSTIPIGDLKAILYKHLDEGCHLFPVGKDKKPLTSHGFKDATQTRSGIDDFIRQYPGCNWAGWLPKQFIIDVDVKHVNGFESLAKLEALLGKLPATRTQNTPSGGRHYIYRQPSGYDIPKADPISKDYPGVDLQANLCYILLPPSFTDAGKYETTDNSPIIDAPIAWCEFALAAKKSNENKADPRPGDIPQTQRNATLTSLAGSMRSRGLTQPVIESALLEVNHSQCVPPLPDSEVLTIARSVSRYEPKSTKITHNQSPNEEIERIKALNRDDILRSLITMDQVESKKIQWWWYPYFAFGKPHLISGDPGSAKSTVSSGFCTLLTRGGGSDMGIKPVIGNVILLSAEDDRSDTIKPRLEAMGADCAKVIIPKERFSLSDSGIALLEKIVQYTNPVMVIIDPISAWFDANVNLNASNEVRKYLAQLSEIAAKYNLILIMIRHLNKGKQEKAIYRGNASIDFTGAARSELMAVKDEDTGDFGLIHIKSNIAPLGKTISYSLTDNGPDSPPTFSWAGYTDLKYSDTTEQSHSSLDEATAWLFQRLQSGKVESNELINEAKKNGINFATLKRAREKLTKENEVISYKDKTVKNGHWYVELVQGKSGEEAQP